MKKITNLLILSLSLVIFTSCGSKKRTGTPEEQIVSAAYDRDVDAVRELLSNGVSADTRGKGDEWEEGPPLMTIVATTYAGKETIIGQFEIVKLLVENGGNINYLHKKIYTPLMNAIYGNNIEIVKFLLESGADINMWVTYTGSPLSRANKLGHTEISEILKSYGAKE